MLPPAVPLGVSQSGGYVSLRECGCSYSHPQQAGQVLVLSGCMTQHSCMRGGSCLHSGPGAPLGPSLLRCLGSAEHVQDGCLDIEQRCLRPWHLPVKGSACAAPCPCHLQDGHPLIKYGERGDKLYLIRYGKVKVLRPDDKGGRIEVAKLGRGSFVGERALIAGEALLRKAGNHWGGSVSAEESRESKLWGCVCCLSAHQGRSRAGLGAPLQRDAR